jgi:UDPglucose--hexose-1-phosphate uridylyltransferase
MDLRRDADAGRWVAYAPARATRPGASEPVEDELASCPFCAGHESMTPPETLRLGDGPTGWRVRVVPNLYPALERQEVVVHGPEHRRSLAELDDTTLDLIAAAWQRRARDTGGTVFALVNEGHVAGASLPHSHSQLAWLPGPPPALTSERGLPEAERVLSRDGLSAGCPRASRVPYELQIAPAEPESDAFHSDLLAPALRLLAELIRRLHAILGGDLPLNAWLHDGPHWHLELLPRTTRLAGLELGADVWINPTPPEEAARELAATASGPAGG